MNIIIVIFTVIALSILLLRWKNHKKSYEDMKKSTACTKAEGACPTGCFCDDHMLRKAIQTDIEYFDDEELDKYAGKQASEYNDQDISCFNDILSTLPPKEVGDWLTSLQLRNIALPEELRDIAFMLMEQNK